MLYRECPDEYISYGGAIPQKPNMNQPVVPIRIQEKVAKNHGLILSAADKMNEVFLPAYRLDSTVTCITVLVEGSCCSW